MDGPTVEVFGNAQDGVGNTMNAGTVVVHGDAGDVLGYGMRGGKVFIKGDVGYRVGIHMKAYEDLRPDHGLRRQGPRLLRRVHGRRPAHPAGHELAGSRARSWAATSAPACTAARSSFGARSRSGRCGKECGIFTADEADIAAIRPSSRSTARRMDMDIDEVLAEPFTKLVPVSHRPYGKLYAY